MCLFIPYSAFFSCAKQAKNSGHRFFGVQNFKECWAGELKPQFFKTTAKARGKGDCWGVRPNYKECSDHTTTKCVGLQQHNYIYEIIPGKRNISLYYNLHLLTCKKLRQLRITSKK